MIGDVVLRACVARSAAMEVSSDDASSKKRPLVSASIVTYQNVTQEDGGSVYYQVKNSPFRLRVDSHGLDLNAYIIECNLVVLVDGRMQPVRNVGMADAEPLSYDVQVRDSLEAVHSVFVEMKIRVLSSLYNNTNYHIAITLLDGKTQKPFPLPEPILCGPIFVASRPAQCGAKKKSNFDSLMSVLRDVWLAGFGTEASLLADFFFVLYFFFQFALGNEFLSKVFERRRKHPCVDETQFWD